MIPEPLHLLAIAGLSLGAVCAGVIAVDVSRHPQRMWIMSVVWPVAALFGTLAVLWGYFRYGRLATRDTRRKPEIPFPVMVGKGALHCGCGCTLGDIFAEWLVFLSPQIAVWFGWGSLFDEKMYAVWIVDYLFAFAFGVAFQYFTIAPMRHLGVMQGIWAAVKADTSSLTAWQLGMYGFMAFAKLYVFRDLLRADLQANSVEFWFSMQIAMLFGFATSYPVNWWLLRIGLKETM